MFRPSISMRLVKQAAGITRSNFKPNLSSRRFLTTGPPHKTSRSWKNSAARWAIAVGGVYWYNTTPLFTEQPQYTAQETEIPLPTLDSLSRSSRFSLPSDQDKPTLPVQPNTNSPPSLDPKSPLPSEQEQSSTQSASELESEALSQGAFNEETGEINWDCPCLGGMAHGPCGPEFREAFSCFVFSKDEPKGLDCVDKFRGMQDCFRAHPEEYGDQLDEDEEEVEKELAAQGVGASSGDDDGVAGAVSEGIATALEEEARQDAAAAGGIGKDAAKTFAKDNGEQKSAQNSKSAKRSIYDEDSDSKTAVTTEPSTKSTSKVVDATKDSSSGSSKLNKDIAGDEGGDLLPKSAHDATDASVSTAR